MTSNDTRLLIEDFYALLWNEWDDASVDRVLSESFQFRGSLGIETTGRDGWRGYRDLIRTGSPDFHNDIVSLVSENDLGGARLDCTGHHDGSLLGLPATGRAFRYAAAAFFRASHGCLVEAWVLGDLEDLRRQLVTP